jgi:hypothetical protein
MGARSWFDDGDDVSDASLSLGQPGRDDNLAVPAGEADDLPGSGNARYGWLSGDDGDARAGEAAPDHAAAGLSGTAEAAPSDTEAPADVVGTGDDVDPDATAALGIRPAGPRADAHEDPDVTVAMGILPGPDADAHEDLDATVAMGILPGPDAAAHEDLDADEDGEAAPDSDVDADIDHAWADLDADPDLDADADPHADAAYDEELPGAADEDDLAPTAAHETIAPEAAATGPASGTGQVTVVPGVPRYHDGDCILIRFMADEDVQQMTVSEAKKAGCTPCRACQPGD